MSDAPEKPKAAAPVAAQAVSPEAEANTRINAIQAQIKALNQEVKIIQGKLANRDPKLAAALGTENETLQKRIKRLELSVCALLIRSNEPTTLDDVKSKYEVLRLAAVEYFKKNNVDAELWKNIVS